MRVVCMTTPEQARRNDHRWRHRRPLPRAGSAPRRDRVTVYERTEARTDWLQGYRIHINPHGSRALHDCLPPAAWQRFLRHRLSQRRRLRLRHRTAHDLLRFAGAEILPEAGPADAHYGASRISLREVLLSGLDDVVHLGKTFERYETGVDGRVTAYFSDGTSATADVLIGADGANSRVRLQLLPDAERIDTGILAIAGKHRLDGANLPTRPPGGRQHDYPDRQRLLFTAGGSRTARYRRGARSRRLPARQLIRIQFLGIRRSASLPIDSRATLGGADLLRVVLDRTAGWAPAYGSHRRLGLASRQRCPGPQRDPRRRMADRTGDSARRRHPQHDADGWDRCQHRAA